MTITFPPPISEVLAPDLLPPLGPGTPNKNMHTKLGKLRIDSAFAPHAVRDSDMADCCLAGLWLWQIADGPLATTERGTPVGANFTTALFRIRAS